MFFSDFIKNPNVWSKNKGKYGENTLLDTAFYESAVHKHSKDKGKYKKTPDDPIVECEYHLKDKQGGDRPEQPVLQHQKHFAVGKAPPECQNEVIDKHQNRTP